MEVLADDALGAVGIARGDGLIDRLMRPIGDELLARLAQGDGPLFGEPGDHGFVNRREHRVARDDRQHVVEGDVRPLERVDVVERQAIGIERRLEFGDLRIARVRRRVPRQPDFEEAARLLEMTHAVRRRQQVARRAGQGLDDDLRRRPRHACPFAAADGDKAHLLQRE